MSTPVSAVYPSYSTGELVHLYVPGYVNPHGTPRHHMLEAPLCNGGTTKGTKKSPRVVGLPKALREPFRWCAPCVGRWLELNGGLPAAMASTIATEQSRAREVQS